MTTRWLSWLIVISLLSINMITLLQNETINADYVNSQEVIKLKYNFSTPLYSSVEIFNDEYARLHLEELPLSGREGEPCIPVKPLRILLPESTTVEKITVDVSEVKILEIDDFNSIELGAMTHSFSRQPIELEYKSITPNYNINELYPSYHYKNLGIQYFRGYAILHINLYPVQYLGKTNSLYYYDEISVEVETKETSRNLLFRGDAEEDIIKMVENAEVLTSYGNDNSFNYNGADNYDYIIITTEGLKNSSGEYTFDDLLNFRESQGLSCTYKTVEEIYDEYIGVDDAEKIRNFIKYAYMNWGTTWVLIGGDVGTVPIRELYDIDGKEPDETDMTSDLYYQCLDGDYNYDGDEYWGEKYDGINGEGIDLYAEVYIGRAPVDNFDDVSFFVEKTLAYENSDWTIDNYLKRHLSAGEMVWPGNGGYGSGYVERCIDRCFDYGQDTYGIPSSKYSIIELYERDMSWTYLDAIDEINQGVHIINHVGHGSMNAAMKISIYDIPNLNNFGKYGLFYSQACHSGKLEGRDQCIAEKWVLEEKKGGFAAIMNTGYGYGSLVDYDGADNRYAREFFDALFSPHEQISRIGKANQDSKEDNFYRLEDDNMYHVYYDTLLFGDPYVEIKGAEDTKADFTWQPSYPLIGETINFYDKSNGDLIYREWDFGDGGHSILENPSHAYTGEGIFEVVLTVYDFEGYMSSVSYDIEVKDQWDPFAIAEPEYYYGYNFTVEFNGNDSWDPDGYIVSYQWNFDDGTTSDIANPIHVFLSEGTYDVRFSVIDNDDNIDTVFCMIVLEEQFPPDIPNKPFGPTGTFTGETYTYTAVTTDPEGNDIKYGWDFGDGSSIKWSDWYNSGETCNISYKWNTLGDHLVRVKVRDIHDAESYWSDPLIVTTTDNKDPTVNILDPEKALYILNKKVIPFFITFTIGSIDFNVSASDESGISRVVFYIDDEPMAEVQSEPYAWTWRRGSILRHRHTVNVVAYDNAGRYSSEELIIWKFL